MVLYVMVTLLIASSAAAIAPDIIEQELKGWKEPITDDEQPRERVIIILKEPEQLRSINPKALDAREKAELKRAMRAEVANRPKTIGGRFYNSFNGFGALVTPQERRALEKHPLVAHVGDDMPVSITMQDTVDLTGASSTWNRTLSGQALTGKGMGVCVIDTGIDYTHTDLGACTYTTKTHNGTEEAIDVQSAHPYTNSYDNTWTITRSGYTSIAVHFTNITLEAPGDAEGVDAWDRVIITDSQGREAARYSGLHADVWTPSVQGDTINVRLVTDSGVTDWGFAIDKAINGTTNTTTDWGSCKSRAAWDFVESDSDPMDDHGHGTHVAGTIAANGSLKGVAPDSHLAIARALDSSGSGWTTDIVAAIEWCTSNAEEHNITAISMSLGGGLYSSACDSSLPWYATAIDDATQKNISVVVASGNNGNHTHISAPGCIQNSLTVASTTKGDAMSSFSNRNSLVRLLAPGSNINSTWISGYNEISGTSMATPHISGAIAVLAQYFGLLGTEKTPSELEDRLAARGVSVDDPTNGLAFSRLDLLNATDNQAPNTTDDAPGWLNNTHNITLSAQDDESGVAYTSYRVDNGSWQNGTVIPVNQTGERVIEYYSVDELGNQETTRTAYGRMDNQTPFTNASAPSGWQNESTSVTLNASDDHSGVAQTYAKVNNGSWAQATIVLIADDGNHTVSYYSVDEAGNTESIKNITVLLDATAPNTTDDDNGSWRTQAYNITLNASDSTSGINQTYYRINNGSWTTGTVITVNQTATYEYYSTDLAGNSETVKTLQGRVDADPPNTTNDAPSGWQRAAMNVTFNATDDASGVDSTWTRLNNDSWTRNNTVIIGVDGNHTIGYYSTDVAGRNETVRNVTVLLDMTAPNTTDDDDGSWRTQAYNITLDATDGTSGINQTLYRIGNGSWTSGTIITINQTATYEYYSNDVAGNNETMRTLQGRVDGAAPITTNDAPSGWQQTAVNVTFNATDDVSGVASIWTRLNNQSWTQNATVSVGDDGNHTISYYSTDIAGNNESVANVTVLIDTTTPNITQILVPDKPGATDNITLGALINETNLAAANMTIDGNESSLSWNGSAYTRAFIPSESGNYSITVRAVDAAGTEHTLTSSMVVYDVDSQTVNVENTTRINISSKLRAALSIKVNQTSSANITVRSTKSTPSDTTARTNAVRYLDIDAEGLNDSMEWALLAIAYNASEVENLDSDTLRISWWNRTDWEDISADTHDWVLSTGRNATHVYANVTHFSIYALVGNEPEEETESASSGGSSGGGGGGGSGGGGGGGSVSSDDPDSQSFRFKQPSSGAVLNLTVNRTALAITRASLMNDAQAISGTVTINRSTAGPDGFSVHDGFAITTGLSISEATIWFDVDEDWLSGVNESTLALWVLNGDEWEELSVSREAEQYKAQSSALGLFAIAAEERVKTAAAPPVNEPAEPEEVAQAQDEESEVLDAAKPQRSKKLLIPLGLGVVALGIIISGRGPARRKKSGWIHHYRR